MVRRRQRRLLACLGLVLLVTGACVSSTPSGSLGSPTDPTVAVPSPPTTTTTRQPSTPRPTPSRPPATASAPVNPAPAELRGTWLTTVGQTRVELTIQANTYRIVRGGNSGQGKVEVVDDVIRFYGANLCSGFGRYTWETVEDRLTFTPLGPEPCAGRTDVLVGTTYRLESA
jgi:hypothetical protein